MSETGIEQEIQAKANQAPRVTLDDIKAVIVSEHYFTAAQGAIASSGDQLIDRFLTWPVPATVHPDGTPGQPGRSGTNLLSAAEARNMLDHVLQFPELPPALNLLTFCVLVLRNGFTVTGESACVSPENFNAEIGREIARENAINKVWQLEGYLLRDKLSKQ